MVDGASADTCHRADEYLLEEKVIQHKEDRTLEYTDWVRKEELFQDSN